MTVSWPSTSPRRRWGRTERTAAERATEADLIRIRVVLDRMQVELETGDLSEAIANRQPEAARQLMVDHILAAFRNANY